eukprot:4367261-Prymnesium_polylepis.1
MAASFPPRSRSPAPPPPRRRTLPAPLSPSFCAFSQDSRLIAALDLVRRMPPARIEQTLEGVRCAWQRAAELATTGRAGLRLLISCGAFLSSELVDLVPDLTDDLLNTIDQPLQLAKDAQGNAYLNCDYNRDGDSYRSPWTNAYDPPIDDGVVPPANLRQLE